VAKTPTGFITAKSAARATLRGTARRKLDVMDICLA